jgi:hypothetical protein
MKKYFKQFIILLFLCFYSILNFSCLEKKRDYTYEESIKNFYYSNIIHQMHVEGTQINPNSELQSVRDKKYVYFNQVIAETDILLFFINGDCIDCYRYIFVLISEHLEDPNKKISVVIRNCDPAVLNRLLRD